MSNLPWFRVYTDILDDEILLLMAFEDRWHFVALMAMKGKGILDKKFPSDDFRDRSIAKKLGLDIETFKDARARLIDAGLIDSKCSPIAWNKRQFKSDIDPTRADRQARFRERQKEKTEEERTSNALRNAPVTPLDTESDTESEKLLTSEPLAVADRNPAKMTAADHVMVVNLYHQVLPELTGVLVNRWHGSKHAKALQARWAESEQHRTPEFWEAFFQTVRLNDWWMGVRNGGGEPWTGCKLAWLVTRSNFDKVLEAGS